MGILGNMFHREQTAPSYPSDPLSTLGSSDTLPAVQPSMTERITAGGNMVLDKATQIYKENPKLVGGLAVLAGAAILAGMKRRGKF